MGCGASKDNQSTTVASRNGTESQQPTRSLEEILEEANRVLKARAQLEQQQQTAENSNASSSTQMSDGGPGGAIRTQIASKPPKSSSGTGGALTDAEQAAWNDLLNVVNGGRNVTFQPGSHDDLVDGGASSDGTRSFTSGSHSRGPRGSRASSSRDPALLNVEELWRNYHEDEKFIDSITRQIKGNELITKVYFDGIDIEMQSRRLVSMIGQGINALAEPDIFFRTMRDLGVRHETYGVAEVDFNRVKEYVCNSLREVAGEEIFDSHAEMTFQWVWDQIRSAMELGARSHEGQQMAEMRRKKKMELVQSAWTAVRAHDFNAQVPFIQRWYENAIKLDDENLSSKLSGFQKRQGAVMKVFYDSMKLRYDQPRVVESMLKALGSRHINYGAGDEEFAPMGVAWVQTIKEVVPDGISLETEYALKEHYAYMTAMMTEGAEAGLFSFENVTAPKAVPLALMFTDIENSTALWSAKKSIMADAVEMHHKVLRQVITDLEGYEVKTVGDAFMVAFKSIDQALAAALHMQVRLKEADWDDFCPGNVKMKGMGPESVWGDALRVRIGIHLCKDVAPTYDPVHQRYDYYGPDVNASSRVQSLACGGEILMTRESHKALASQVVEAGDNSFEQSMAVQSVASDGPRGSSLVGNPLSSAMNQSSENNDPLSHGGILGGLAHQMAESHNPTTGAAEADSDDSDTGSSEKKNSRSVTPEHPDRMAVGGFHHPGLANNPDSGVSSDSSVTSLSQMEHASNSKLITRASYHRAMESSTRGGMQRSKGKAAKVKAKENSAMKRMMEEHSGIAKLVARSVTLKGVSEPVDLVSIVPAQYAARQFPKIVE